MKTKKLRLILLIALLLLTGCPSPHPTPTPDPTPTPAPSPGYQSNIGRAPYALQSKNFDCNAFYNSLSAMKAYSIAYVENTFGNEHGCLDRVFGDTRLRAVEVHLANEVCAKYPRCGAYEIYYGYSVPRIQSLLENKDPGFMAKFKGYAQNTANYLLPKFKARPDIECLVSPSLESNLSTKAMTNLIQMLRPVFPGCKFVAAQSNATADFVETHNVSASVKAPCIFDNDGVSISFPGLPSSFPRNFKSTEIPTVNQRFSQCRRSFFWIHDGDNCIESGAFVDPRKRSCKEIRRHGLLGFELGKLQK